MKKKMSLKNEMGEYIIQFKMRKSGNPLLNFEIQIQEKSGKLNV
jgi:hypothetical protein